MEAACQTIRDDLGELKRAIGSEHLPGTAQRARDYVNP
jgi:hypothetical protein